MGFGQPYVERDEACLGPEAGQGQHEDQPRPAGPDGWRGEEILELQAAGVATQQQKGQDRDRALNLDLLKSAAVSAEKLVGTPESDKYLQFLQPLLEQAEAEATHWLENMGNAMEEQHLRLAQCNYHQWVSRARTIKELMELPNQIIGAHQHYANA